MSNNPYLVKVKQIKVINCYCEFPTFASESLSCPHNPLKSSNNSNPEATPTVPPTSSLMKASEPL